jgi:hypothetical protein
VRKLAWEQKNLDRFMKMYHPDFEHEGMNYGALLKTKKNFFRKYRTIRVEVDRWKSEGPRPSLGEVRPVLPGRQIQ